MNITKEQFEVYVESFGLTPLETTSNMIGWYCHVETGVPLTALDKFTRIWPEESRLGRMLHLSNEDALKFGPEFFLPKKAVRTDKVIYKYQLGMVPRNSIMMPVGAKILTIGTHGGTIYVWAIVTPGTTEERIFLIEGTGERLTSNAGTELSRYIRTIRIGDFFWHVFEDLGKK